MSSACWDGHFSLYEVKDKQLLLRYAVVQLDGDDKKAAVRGSGPVVYGEHPQKYSSSQRCHDDWLNAHYHHLSQSGVFFYNPHKPIDFTGGLLLGYGIVDEDWEIFCYHPAWNFEEVFELIFENGRLRAAIDRSAYFEKRREYILSTPPDAPAKPTLDELWNEIFERDYYI